MSYVTPAQLAAQRSVTTPTFTDTCLRLVYASADGDYGPGTVASYTQGTSMPCSFQPKPVRDVQSTSEVPITDADLYLAHDAALDPEDRVTITYLYGEAVANPLTYNIIEGPVVDGNVMHVGLRLVTDGSDDVED